MRPRCWLSVGFPKLNAGGPVDVICRATLFCVLTVQAFGNGEKAQAKTRPWLSAKRKQARVSSIQTNDKDSARFSGCFFP